MATITDQPARERIRDDTGSTLFVDAGAGSGKTKSLLDRVTTLVLVDGVSLRNIAAVTFTDKAGAELRDRLRAEFEKVWKGGSKERPSSEEDKDRAATALDDLDGAAIGTLHSFAQRILTMHPIEAGLPPLLEVLDEVGSSVAFDARWSVMQRELLDDEALAQSVRLALAAGAKLEQLRCWRGRSSPTGTSSKTTSCRVGRRQSRCPTYDGCSRRHASSPPAEASAPTLTTSSWPGLRHSPPGQTSTPTPPSRRCGSLP